MQTIILIGLPIIFGITGQLLLKSGMMQIGKFSIMNAGIIMQMVKIFMNPFVLSGFICYALASVVWIITLSRIPLSYAYPMLSINYIGILLGSSLLFGETVSPTRWIGVMVICFGVVLIGRS